MRAYCWASSDWRPDLVDTKMLRLALCVSVVHTGAMEKDVGFRIRLDRELREEFLAACRVQDRPAAQVLREFMRDYVASHRFDGAEGNMRIVHQRTSGTRNG